MTKTCLSKILDDLEPKTTELNQDILDAVVGVSMAITDVRKALDKVDACIDKRNFADSGAFGQSFWRHSATCSGVSGHSWRAVLRPYVLGIMRC